MQKNVHNMHSMSQSPPRQPRTDDAARSPLSGASHSTDVRSARATTNKSQDSAEHTSSSPKRGVVRKLEADDASEDHEFDRHDDNEEEKEEEDDGYEANDSGTESSDTGIVNYNYIYSESRIKLVLKTTN